MRSLTVLAVITVLFSSCDDQRVYDKNIDFDSRFWQVDQKPEFEFVVADSSQSFNLFCNVRNSLDYPYARVFVNWILSDSTGAVMEKDLAQHMLFDEKTGEPFGQSGLGDIYDHRILLKRDYRFPYRGKYKVSLEQYMRTDTLSGILAVGVRLERAGMN